MKAAIIGGASSSKYAPWEDESWQTWCLGNQLQRFEGKRISRLFEIHENLDEHDERYPQWLVDKNIPLVLSEKFPINCDHSIVFDYEKAKKMIGENFSSSPAVMMAQAIMDGATTIGIWGVDMALDCHEYFMQRPSMEQWIGYARGKGINVYIHPSSPLGFSTYREGRDWPDKGHTGFSSDEYMEMHDRHLKRYNELESELNNVLPKMEQMKAEAQALNGAMQVYKRLSQVSRAKSSGFDVGIADGANNRTGTQ